MRILKNILLLFIGFIGGIVAFVTFIDETEDLTCEKISRCKHNLIDKFEKLLLGYNTIKTKPYRPYYRPSHPRYRSNYYTTSYNDYYKRSFEEDELD